MKISTSNGIGTPTNIVKTIIRIIWFKVMLATPQCFHIVAMNCLIASHKGRMVPVDPNLDWTNIGCFGNCGCGWGRKSWPTQNAVPNGFQST